jgi:hypothetical protein
MINKNIFVLFDPHLLGEAAAGQIYSFRLNYYFSFRQHYTYRN